MMLPALEQVFWVCAMISSFFFVIQLLLTLIGMDSSDVSVDFDGPDTMDLGGGVSLFTVGAEAGEKRRGRVGAGVVVDVW